MRSQIPRFDGTAADPWQTITPNAPFTINAAFQVRIDMAGNVHLRGDLDRNAAADGEMVCMLPEEYRPTQVTYRLLLTAPIATSSGYLTVATSGAVSLSQRTGTVTRFYINSAAPYSAL